MKSVVANEFTLDLKIEIQIINYRFEQKSLCISLCLLHCVVSALTEWEGKGNILLNAADVK